MSIKLKSDDELSRADSLWCPTSLCCHFSQLKATQINQISQEFYVLFPRPAFIFRKEFIQRSPEGHSSSTFPQNSYPRNHLSWIASQINPGAQNQLSAFGFESCRTLKNEPIPREQQPEKRLCKKAFLQQMSRTRSLILTERGERYLLGRGAEGDISSGLQQVLCLQGQKENSHISGCVLVRWRPCPGHRFIPVFHP